MLSIINHFYPNDDALKSLLLMHSRQVRNKAVTIAAMPENRKYQIDLEILANGAMLHDIGIRECNAPSIYCTGTQPYLAHGVVGARMLREYATLHPEFNVEPYARICERHTGAGISAYDVVSQHLPLEVRDYLPETYEEQLICLADKFYSKSRPAEELTVEDVRHSLAKFGDETLARFDRLCETFHL
jgi:uncharacterized protein